MEQLKRVLKLYREGQPIKGIVRLTGLSRNTVRSYLARASDEVRNTRKQTGAALADIFYNQDTAAYKVTRYQDLLKHFVGSERELCRRGVTQQLLWREYMELHPEDTPIASTAVTCSGY